TARSGEPRSAAAGHRPSGWRPHDRQTMFGVARVVVSRREGTAFVPGRASTGSPTFPSYAARRESPPAGRATSSGKLRVAWSVHGVDQHRSEMLLWLQAKGGIR